MPNVISNHPPFGITRMAFRGVAAAGVIALLVLLSSQTTNAATITVTTTSDDQTPNDGSVSLREAIMAMNAGNDLGDPDIALQNPGAFGTNNTIKFTITGAGVKTINVGSSASASGLALPTITKPVTINGYSQPNSSVNTIANSGNAVILIELNGTSAGSGHSGLTLGTGSAGSSIRGLAINRFPGNGIVVQSNGNTISGNFIGTNPGGGTRMPNGTFPNFGDGILIQNASNNIIGTAAPADRNVISGNALDGVHIVGTLVAPASGNKIQGNFIGIDKGGINAVGNRTEPAPAPGVAEGNNLHGIEISGGDNNIIGGTAAGTRNVIGFNGDGITLDNGAQNNTIQGNFLGVGANGAAPTGNLLHGVSLRSSNGFGAPLGPAQPNEPGVSFNTIGGTAAGAGNLIEFNGTAGIAVFGNPVSASGQPNIRNAILGNSIFQNGRSYLSASSAPLPLLGIDLTNQFGYPRDDGATANDSKGHGAANDPNDFQDFPVLTTATSSGGTTNIAGTLSSTANSTFRIEFFASDTDPLGLPAEGQQFLGFTNASTDANGAASFNQSLSVSVTNGRIVTATATDGFANTSEFSAGIVPTEPSTPTPTPTPTPTATPTPAPTATPTPTPIPPSQLLNLSTRKLVGAGDNVLIGGFIIIGTDDKKVLVRGLGPSLPLSGALEDPTLEIHKADTSLVAANNNWKDSQEPEITATGIPPSNDLESALVTSLAAKPLADGGAGYTAILAGSGGGTGIGLLEIYDLAIGADSTLANISTRGFVGTGDDLLIGGFIPGPSDHAVLKVLVRALGPSLTGQGVSGALQDPVLELHDANGTLVMNDNWKDASNAAEIQATLPPPDDRESAIITTLAPSNAGYTAVVRGAGDTTGVALVEVFALP